MEYEDAPDPHAWMDLSFGLIYIDNMRKALLQLMPEHVEEIQKKYDTYYREIKQLNRWIQDEVNRIPKENRVLITSHDAFQYFGQAYGMELHATMGLSTDADVKTGDIIHITNLLETRSIPAIFIESTINPKLLEQIAADYGVEIGGELFADALSDASGPAGTYLNLFRHNTKVITEALTRTEEKEESNASRLTHYISYAFIFAIMLSLFISAYIKLS